MRTIETWLAAKIIALDLNRAIDKAERLPYGYERERVLLLIASALALVIADIAMGRMVAGMGW